MIRNQTNTIVIRPRTSKAVIAILVGLALVFVAAGVAGAYYFGRWQMQAQLDRAEQQLAEQSKRYQGLNQQYEEVRGSFAQLKRQLHIDDSVYAQLREELDQSNSLLGELRSELEFYRSIISPQEGQQGVRVQEFTVRPTPHAETFEYKLVLIQTLQQGDELSATVSLIIRGESRGESKTIEYPGPDKEKMQVKFKYFQNLTGVLELPEAFTPTQVRIDLAGNGKSSLLEEKWYSWAELTGADAS